VLAGSRLCKSKLLLDSTRIECHTTSEVKLKVFVV
jgi:hypothetical protein